MSSTFHTHGGAAGIPGRRLRRVRRRPVPPVGPPPPLGLEHLAPRGGSSTPPPSHAPEPLRHGSTAERRLVAVLTSLALALGLGGTVLVLDAPAIARAEVHAALRADPVGTLTTALAGGTAVGSGVTVAGTSSPPAFAGGEVDGEVRPRSVHSTGFSPRSLSVPAIGLTTDVFATGNTPDGNLEVPADPQQVGWFRGLAEPGDPGVSVLLGHVDSREGPGVFWRLDELAPGDRFEVERSDGRVVHYEVERVDFHDKDAFPASEVYTSQRDEVLRLITCGGEFDRDRRTYEENVVVTAVPVPDRAVSTGRV